MKQISIVTFWSSRISKETSNNLKGGMGFCDWYLNKMTSTGQHPNAAYMKHLIKLDQQYNSQIPAHIDPEAIYAQMTN